MATSTILSNPKVTIGGIDLSGWCTSATLTKTVTALNDTVFGNTANTFTAGLEDNELSVTLFLKYWKQHPCYLLSPKKHPSFLLLLGQNNSLKILGLVLP